MVKVMGQGDQHLDCRVLLDNCSDESFISSSLVTRLGLKRQRLATPQNVQALQGVGVATITEAAQIKLTSRYNPTTIISVVALIVKSIGGQYPHAPLDTKDWSHIPAEGLADPSFHNPGP
ncbi:unnamed protein product, partial [Allacma fusca]